MTSVFFKHYITVYYKSPSHVSPICLSKRRGALDSNPFTVFPYEKVIFTPRVIVHTTRASQHQILSVESNKFVYRNLTKASVCSSTPNVFVPKIHIKPIITFCV